MTKKRSTKRALFMSALSLLLCVSMLVGTTFAWFTDEVVSGMNTIAAGNLDVELLADGTPVDADTKLFADATLWEPGVVVYENLQIVNAGTLALKYQMTLNFGNENTLNGHKLSEVLSVAVLDTAIADGADRATILAAAQNAKFASLYDFVVAGELEAGDETAEQAVVIFWAPNANEIDNLYNANNGQKTSDEKPLRIEFGVNLQATQKMSESDSFGSDYDADAKYNRDVWNGVTTTTPVADADGVYRIYTAAELVGMMNDSKYPNCNKYQNVVLETNIDLNGATVSGFGDDSGFFDGIFDGQGYTISNFKIDATNRTYYAGLFNQLAQYSGENTVVKNLTVANATVKGSGQVGAIVGGMNGNTVVDNCKVINCTLSGVKKVGSVVGYTAGGTVTNNYAENCVVLYSEKEGGEIIGYLNTGSTESNNIAKNITMNLGSAVASTDELIKAIKAAPVGKETTIYLTDGTYAEDIDITVAALGASYGDVVIKASEGANPVITGLVTLGYRNQGVGAAMYDANVTFEGITFDQAENAKHSIQVEDVKSLTLKNCTIIGDGEYGVGCARGNATGASKIIGCTFKNSSMQLLGNFATGLVIDGCTFDESRINVQGGNGVTVQNCKFENTLTAANVGDSFYAIRSNSTAITVKDCEFKVDSELTEVATAQSKWYLLANRGTTNWTVENVAVTLTVAAQQQTELDITACTSTGLINTTNVTVNGVAL